MCGDWFARDRCVLETNWTAFHLLKITGCDSDLGKIVLLAFHGTKSKTIAGVIQVAVVVRDVIEATCSEDDGGSGGGAVF